MSCFTRCSTSSIPRAAPVARSSLIHANFAKKKSASGNSPAPAASLIIWPTDWRRQKKPKASARIASDLLLRIVALQFKKLGLGGISRPPYEPQEVTTVGGPQTIISWHSFSDWARNANSLICSFVARSVDIGPLRHDVVSS